MENILISQTGTLHGRGSDKFKWVSGLTAEERELVKNGGIVLIKTPYKHHTVTEYKIVTVYNGKFSHRNYYPL